MAFNLVNPEPCILGSLCPIVHGRAVPIFSGIVIAFPSKF